MWVPATTAWRVLGLRMEEQPPIWRVTVNKLNKQTRGGPPAWGLDEVLTTPLRKKKNVKNYPLDEMLPLETKQSGGKLLPHSDWMELAQDRDGRRSLVGTARNFRVP